MATFGPQQPTVAAPVTTPDLGERASSEAPMQTYQNFLDTLPSPTPMDSSTPQTMSGPDSLDEIGNQFQGGIKQIQQGAGEIMKGQGITGFGDIGAGVIGAAFSPAAPATDVIGNGVQGVANKIASIPAVQKFANTKVGQGVAANAKDLANYSAIAGTVAGGVEAPDAATAVMNKISPPPDLAGMAQESVTPDVRAAQSEDFKTIPVDEAGVPVTPKNATGPTIPRVMDDGQGNLTVNNTRAELDSAAELQKSPAWQKLKTENPDASSQEQLNAIQPELKAKDTALDASLKATKVTVKPTEVLNYFRQTLTKLEGSGYALRAAPGAVQDYLTQISDSMEKLNIDPKKPMTMDQVYDLKQQMTKEFIAHQGDTSLGPPDAPLKGLAIAQKVGNQAFTDFIDSKVPDAEIKGQLKSSTDLHNASDALATKAKTEPVQAPSMVGKFLKNHPTIARNGGYLIRSLARRFLLGSIK